MDRPPDINPKVKVSPQRDVEPSRASSRYFVEDRFSQLANLEEPRAPIRFAHQDTTSHHPVGKPSVNSPCDASIEPHTPERWIIVSPYRVNRKSCRFRFRKNAISMKSNAGGACFVRYFKLRFRLAANQF